MQKILNVISRVEALLIQIFQILNTEIYGAFCEIGNHTDSITVKVFHLRCAYLEPKQLSINGRPLTVVGVLKRNAELEMLPGSQDDQIYIPYTTALEIMGSRWVNLYIFTSTSG